MNARVALMDHGMGNLKSVAKALEAAGADVRVVEGAGELGDAVALCVPGQGIFGRCVTNMRSAGFDDLVRDWVAAEKPYLGICLGLQVLFTSSEEPGVREGLNVLQGEVRRLSGDVRVPHMGWNVVNENYFYFDHSYAVHPAEEGIVSGWCEHGERFAASIESGSILGVQFHPEKSSTTGIQLLERWVNNL